MRFLAPLTLMSLTLAGCSPESTRETRPDDTQVVVQWPLKDLPPTTGRVQAVLQTLSSSSAWWRAEDEIVRAGGDLYTETGNDIGGGTFNVYLYTQKVEATVQRVVGLERTGKIPPGLRIGVAVYKDASRKDWSYRAVWPAGLKTFDIMDPPSAGPAG